MKIQRFYIQNSARRLLLAAVLALVFCAPVSYASIALQNAWSEFSVQAASYRASGLDTTRKILKTAFTLNEQEVIALKSTQIFIELFDALVTKIAQTSLPDAADSLYSFRNHMFNNVLVSPIVRQKIALEIFKNHKKWGIVITNTGLVASVDTIVFMGFVRSLKSIFVALTGGGAHFVSHENLNILNKLIDDLNLKFKPNSAVVALKGAGHVAARGLKISAAVTHKVASATYSKSMGLLSKIDASVLKQAVLMAGAVSVTALVISGSYMINNKKRLAREFIEMAGGIDEVKGAAAKMYLMPESRTKRMIGFLKSWSHDAPDFRAAEARRAQECLKSSGRPEAAEVVDPLRDVLVAMARDPKSVRDDSLKTAQELMAQDIQDKRYSDKKSDGKDKTIQSQRAYFEKVSYEYLKALGKAPSFWRRFAQKMDHCWPGPHSSLEPVFQKAVSVVRSSST